MRKQETPHIIPVDEARLVSLVAENEKLRVELTDLRLESCPSCGIKVKNEELRDENARLRELLTDLAVCACGKYCYGCPHQYDGCDRDERLRELGVRVEL